MIRMVRNLGVLMQSLRRHAVDIINQESMRSRLRAAPSATIRPTVRITGKPELIEIGEGCVINHEVALTCSGSAIKLGDAAIINSFTIIETGSGGRIEIGAGSKINSFCTIYGQGGLTIGTNVRIGPRVGIFPSNKHFADADRPIGSQGLSKDGIRIGDNAWIGSSVQIMDGASVGEGAVIGAGSVVTTDIPPFAIAAGVPARVISMRKSASIVDSNSTAESELP